MSSFSKSIRNNQRGLYCCLCKRWLHLSCTSFTIKEYQSLLPTSEVRYCHICLASIFQFDNTSDNLEYMNCIFNLGYSRTSSSNYIFSTCQLSLVSKKLGTDHNIDRDYNCIRQDGKDSIHYLDTDFNDFVDKNSIFDVHFSILHINTRSNSKLYFYAIK